METSSRVDLMSPMGNGDGECFSSPFTEGRISLFTFRCGKKFSHPLKASLGAKIPKGLYVLKFSCFSKLNKMLILASSISPRFCCYQTRPNGGILRGNQGSELIAISDRSWYCVTICFYTVLSGL